MKSLIQCLCGAFLMNTMDLMPVNDSLIVAVSVEHGYFYRYIYRSKTYCLERIGNCGCYGDHLFIE